MRDGDGSAPIENGAFIVQNNRFTQVGRKGQVNVPAGAAPVDLTGKTVMPLQRKAYYGVAGLISLGQDPGDLPFQMREHGTAVDRATLRSRWIGGRSD